MLILNKVENLGCLCLSYKFERSYLERSSQFAQYLLRPVLTKGFLQKIFGITNTTLRNILLSKADFIKLI